MDAETWRLARPIVAAGSILLAIVVALLILVRIREFIAIFFLGVVLGIALNPIVDALGRFNVPKLVSVLLVYLVVGTLFTVFLYFAFLEIKGDAFDLELETLKEDYEELRAGTGLPTSAEVEESLEAFLEDAAQGLAGRAMSFFGALASVFTVLFIGLLFTITEDRMKAVTLTFIPPANRERAEEILGKLAVGIRGYLRGELVAMTVIGVVTYIGLELLGIRLALVLAFIAFLFELLPLIGPWLAFIPALFIALTEGSWAAIQVSLLYLGIQALENYIVTPIVHGHQSQVPALLILSALLVGGSLMGILGALVAIPVAVILHILFFELVVPWTEKRYRHPAPVGR